jgi:putative heme-binding domain-containing protein
MIAPSSGNSRGSFRPASLILALLLAASLARAADTPDVEAGRKLFQGMCVTCHGFEGKGGDAPSLTRARLDHAPDDAALRALIADGLPARGMPRVRRMTDTELRQLVAYVRSLGRLPPAPTTANAGRGAGIYQRLGCATCHVINGQGGVLGPELTAIGRMRGPDYLRQAIVEAGATLPRATLPVPARGYGEFLPVLVVKADGSEVRGVRLNEDAMTIQVRDLSSQTHSFRKSDVQRIEKQRGTSVMPSFAAQLNAAELDDLVAYLTSLRGAR